MVASSPGDADGLASPQLLNEPLTGVRPLPGRPGRIELRNAELTSPDRPRLTAPLLIRRRAACPRTPSARPPSPPRPAA